MQEKHITNIKVDVALQGEDAQFFNMLQMLSAKGNTNASVKDFIEFVFYTGFTFLRGQFFGAVHSEKIKEGDENNSNLFESIYLHKQNRMIDFDKIIFNGLEVKYKFSDENCVLWFRRGDNQRWNSLSFLKEGKSLQWKGSNEKNLL